MVALPAQRRYSIQEYLRLEAFSNVRHEWLGGQIFAMAGGTPEHGVYSANVIALLATAVRGKRCRVQSSDVRIRVPATGLDTYPDASVVCGHVEVDAEDKDAVTNPVLIVEVLSPSTRDYDRGEKLENYQQLASLTEVLFVDPTARALEVVRRTGGGWTRTSSDVKVRLASIDAELLATEVFHDPLAAGP